MLLHALYLLWDLHSLGFRNKGLLSFGPAAARREQESLMEPKHAKVSNEAVCHNHYRTPFSLCFSFCYLSKSNLEKLKAAIRSLCLPAEICSLKSTSVLLFMRDSELHFTYI